MDGNRIMLNKTIQCKDCKFFYGTEHSVHTDFIKGVNYSNFRKQNIRLPSGTSISDTFPIRMCQHDSCFQNMIYTDPVEGEISVKERIKGQGQLNQNNDCILFKKRTIIDRLKSILCLIFL
jgi:hypothetical protein